MECEIDSNSLKAINLSFFAAFNKISYFRMKWGDKGDTSFWE